MWRTKCKNKLSLILCMVLIAAMALCTTGCKDSKQDAAGSEVKQESSAGAQETEGASDQDAGEQAAGGEETGAENSGSGTEVQETGEATGDAAQNDNVLGEGNTEFAFTVTDADGNETAFTIRTDKKLVGEALQEVGLIDGEAGPYGLYVKTVNGTTLDFDTDGKYWAFYVDGEYGMSGVDTTEIVADTVYSFKAE